jgi:hypothetical protein
MNADSERMNLSQDPLGDERSPVWAHRQTLLLERNA